MRASAGASETERHPVTTASRVMPVTAAQKNPRLTPIHTGTKKSVRVQTTKADRALTRKTTASRMRMPTAVSASRSALTFMRNPVRGACPDSPAELITPARGGDRADLRPGPDQPSAATRKASKVITPGVVAPPARLTCTP
jgi:hypothetical protein